MTTSIHQLELELHFRKMEDELFTLTVSEPTIKTEEPIDFSARNEFLLTWPGLYKFHPNQ